MRGTVGYRIYLPSYMVYDVRLVSGEQQDNYYIKQTILTWFSADKVMLLGNKYLHTIMSV